MRGCPHYLELPTGIPDAAPQVFECERELGHRGHHQYVYGGQAVGPRPLGGRVRKNVAVWIEWGR